MAEAVTASPGSTVDSGKKPAVKNTTCRYCGVPFTTSSLGRHLDLYIREKNPKPADDVHDIDEIRRTRGNVTRRQAKTSAKREGSTPSNSKGTPVRDQRSPSSAIQHSGRAQTRGAQSGAQWNRANWQATGVINGLPPTSRASTSCPVNRTEGPRSNKLDITIKEIAIEERDRAQAVEHALKEVLSNIRAATLRTHPPSPFDCEFFRQGFPALCLRCMPPPRSMSSHHSNLGQETWPLDPPGPSEYEYMKRYVFAKLQEWKARLAQADHQSNQNGDVNQQLSDNLAKEEATYQQHFAQAYTIWNKLSLDKKQEHWRLECQKAYAEEYDRHQDTRERLDQLEQEIHHLRDTLDQKKSGQVLSGLEFSAIPLSRTTMAAVRPQEVHDLQHWDYDGLVDKWKHRIQQQRSNQHPLPTVPSWSPNRPQNGPPSVYGHRPLLDDQTSYHTDGDNEMEDEDLADAPGEDEDEDVATTTAPRNGIMDRDVLDPNLRHGNGNLDDGGRMLMELKGFQGAANGDGGR
ncbi:MAG: hypothetical protein Q9186_001960 [Xanthomendoza sp. 1 TL-2023]